MGFDKRPRVRRAPRRAAVADRVLPAGRPRRARRRPRRSWCCCPGGEDRGSGTSSGRWRSPRSTRSGDARALPRPAAPMSTAALETQVDLRRSRLETMLKVLDVDGAVRRVRGGWEATGEPWSYDAERYARVAATRGAEQQAMVDYVGTSGCRMAFLRDALDDPERRLACGRCDRCGGLELPGARTEAAAARAGAAGRPAWSSRGGKSGRPAWPRSGSTSRARSPTGRAGPGGRPARPTSAGPARSATCSPRRATARFRCRWCKAVVEVLARLATHRSTAIVVVESVDPARRLVRDLADGPLALPPACPIVAQLRHRRPRRSRQVAVRSTPPSGSRP